MARADVTKGEKIVSMGNIKVLAITPRDGAEDQ
jgi:hypothetical protein